MTFTRDQLDRYSRHLLLPEFAGGAQETLLAARVLCIGAGGLGSPAILYLAAAGVGTIGIVDADRVELSNLQRQVVHGTYDVGHPKAMSAAETVEVLNPDVEVEVHEGRFDVSNARDYVDRYDVVVDGSDNFATRYLANDACFMARKPLCFGSVFRFEGQATTFDFRREGAPCYRCLFPEAPPAGMVPSCAEAGILGAVVGLIGVTQAVEAIKLITGIGEPLVGRLQLLDAMRMEWRTVRYKRSPQCALCGDAPSITELAAIDAPACAVNERQ